MQKLVVSKVLARFRSLTERDVTSTSMGASGVDVKLSEAAYKSFPFSVECKFQQVNKSFINMWEQAKDNTSKLNDALLVLKANHTEVVVVMHIDKLMEILNDRT